LYNSKISDTVQLTKFEFLHVIRWSNYGEEETVNFSFSRSSKYNHMYVFTL